MRCFYIPRCKGTIKFAFLQILSGKSDCDKYLNKNTGLVSPIKINKIKEIVCFALKNAILHWRAKQRCKGER